jgi:hypothetical protein
VEGIESLVKQFDAFSVTYSGNSEAFWPQSKDNRPAQFGVVEFPASHIKRRENS